MPKGKPSSLRHWINEQLIVQKLAWLAFVNNIPNCQRKLCQLFLRAHEQV
jgi:hypothetical protein